MEASRHCCVVGAGPGIGIAVADAFAAEGCRVSLLSRQPKRLDPLMAELRKRTGREAQALAADAADPASLRAALQTAAERFGAIEILVYNVASHGTARPLALTPERLSEDFHSNVIGALVAAQTVAPAMRAARRGTLLFTGGGFAYEPSANYASLSVGKSALRNLVYSLAQELGNDGLHVGLVTVYGFIQSGTHFDPQRIAQRYVDLHRQPRGHYETEVIYK
jgi:short-subunit dehydrogenase